MSVTVDANVLVYASNEADPAHAPARELVKRLAAGPDLVYLFWPTVMGCLPIVTHTAVLPRPLAPAEATANVEALLARAHDARLAALTRQHGVGTIYTRDRDFRRFDGITARRPVRLAREDRPLRLAALPLPCLWSREP